MRVCGIGVQYTMTEKWAEVHLRVGGGGKGEGRVEGGGQNHNCNFLEAKNYTGMSFRL